MTLISATTLPIVQSHIYIMCGIDPICYIIAEFISSCFLKIKRTKNEFAHVKYNTSQIVHAFEYSTSSLDCLVVDSLLGEIIY